MYGNDIDNNTWMIGDIIEDDLVIKYAGKYSGSEKLKADEGMKYKNII